MKQQENIRGVLFVTVTLYDNFSEFILIFALLRCFLCISTLFADNEVRSTIIRKTTLNLN
jgi:hypothetical protein